MSSPPTNVVSVTAPLFFFTFSLSKQENVKMANYEDKELFTREIE
jgi:hypothetical protein